MVKKFTPEDNEKMTAEWYGGSPRKGIEVRHSASGGYVSNLIQKEKQIVGEGNVHALRRLAIQVGKEKYNVVEIVRAARFLNVCNKTMEMDDEEVIEYILNLLEICNKDGIKLKDLILDMESRIAKIKECETIIAAKEKAIQESEKRHQEVLRKENQTYESLVKFDKLESILKKYGLPIDEEPAEKLANALVNAEASGYDVKSVVDAIATRPSLEEKNFQLSIHNSNIQKEIYSNSKLLEQQSAEIKKNSRILNSIDEAKQLGFGNEELKIITETATKVSIGNGIDSKAAVKKLMQDISNDEYDIKVGFEKKAAEYKKKYEEQEAKYEKLKLDYAKYTNSIAALEALGSKGVKHYQIVEINYTIENSGAGNEVNIAELNHDIIINGSLKSANKEAEKINKDLLAKNLALKEENKQLECHNESLRKTSDNFLNSFKEKIEGFNNESKVVFDGVKATAEESNQIMKGQTGLLIQFTTDLMNQAKNVLAAVAEGQQKILENNRILDFEPLSRARSGQEVSRESTISSLISAIDAVIPYLGTSIILRDIRTSLEMARNKLADYLNHPLPFM